MGKWQLECVKFGTFIFAPVVSFYWFHRIENFEDKIEQYHRATTTADSLKNEELIGVYQHKMRENRDKRFKEELESIRANDSNVLREKLARFEEQEKN
jgi:hypothetical protein